MWCRISSASTQPEIHVDRRLPGQLRASRVELVAGRVDPGQRGPMYRGHQGPGGLKAERALDGIPAADRVPDIAADGHHQQAQWGHIKPEAPADVQIGPMHETGDVAAEVAAAQ